MKKNRPTCIEVSVETLGDWCGPQTPEFPEGKYINYHACPSPSVDILKHAPSGILKENKEEPLFVLQGKIGKEKFAELAKKIFEELKKELV